MVLRGRMRLHRMLFGLFGYSLLLVGAYGVSREFLVLRIFTIGFGFFVRWLFGGCAVFGVITVCSSVTGLTVAVLKIS